MSSKGAAASLDHPFWRFSLQVWKQPDVPEACIALQDRLGIDVNLLLFVLWLSREGRQVAPEQLRELAELTAPWRTSIEKLRAIRRSLKAQASEPAIAGFRRRIAALELEGEQLEQAALYAWSAERGLPPAPPPLALAANIACWKRTLLESEAADLDFPPALKRAAQLPATDDPR